MDECKSLVHGGLPERQHGRQELTLVHLSAQRKRFLLDRGRVYGLFRGRLGAYKGVLRGITGYYGVLRGVQGMFLFKKQLRLS